MSLCVVQSVQIRLVRLVVSSALLAIMFAAAIPAVSTAQPPSSGCGYVLGFAQLRDDIAAAEGEDVVGGCRENELHLPNGDGLQLSYNGLLIWRKSSNWTGFSDGKYTWVNGPFGLQKRSHLERLVWEEPRADVAEVLSNVVALPREIEVDEVVRQVLVLHSSNGGSTFNLFFGDMLGSESFAVSIYPERSVVLPGKDVPIGVLRQFIVDNLDLLRDPRVSVGSWFSTDSKASFLDISATVPGRQQAIELGRKYNQIAIFDLASMQEISVGGTGEKSEGMPPPRDRLPKLMLSGR